MEKRRDRTRADADGISGFGYIMGVSQFSLSSLDDHAFLVATFGIGLEEEKRRKGHII